MAFFSKGHILRKIAKGFFNFSQTIARPHIFGKSYFSSPPLSLLRAAYVVGRKPCQIFFRNFTRGPKMRNCVPNTRQKLPYLSPQLFQPQRGLDLNTNATSIRGCFSRFSPLLFPTEVACNSSTHCTADLCEWMMIQVLG